MDSKLIIFKDITQELALAGCNTSILQLQINDDFFKDVSINLNIKDAQLLADNLNRWIKDRNRIEEENEKKAKYCYGMSYNFKKGMEHCTHREDCKLFKAYKNEFEMKNHAELPMKNFKYIKDFRNCKLYKNV